MTFELVPVGVIHSCFKEKFGIPRQPGLVPEAEARLEMLPPYDRGDALRGLEAFSHLWVIFVFHRCLGGHWRPTVRPPRLGGNRRIGVFASRSPFRPNPIGLSVVELRGICEGGPRRELLLGGVDLLDGTPVLDIKPYLPYADRVEQARGGFAQGAPEATVAVELGDQPLRYLARLPQAEARGLERLIRSLLRYDPRPAYLGNSIRRKEFGMRIHDVNVRWEARGARARVTRIEPGEE